MPWFCGFVCWLVVGVLLFGQSAYGSDISEQSDFGRLVSSGIVTNDGHATLSWFESWQSGATIYRVTESGPAGNHSSLVEDNSLNIYRVKPGTYNFSVTACQRDVTGYPECSNISQFLKVVVTEEINALYNQRDDAVSIDAGKETEPPVNSRGPGLLRPGLWYNEDRNGHGWSFYWANRLALPESHALFGSEYDLLGVWYSYEARSRFQDGPPPCGEGYFGPECYWVFENYLPVALQLKLVRSGEHTYTGGVYITRNDKEEHVGAATVTFGDDNQHATVDWQANFKWQHLSGSDPITLLAGAVDDSVNNNTHYSGFWGAVDRDDLFVIDDVGFYSEAVEVVFEDEKGDPAWIQATRVDSPETTDTSLCFYYISSGYAPNSTGSVAFYNSGCDPSQEVGATNRNGWRHFDGFESSRMWVSFGLPPHLERGEVKLGSAQAPSVLVKRASFHRIAYVSPQGAACELTATMPVCEIQVSWFTDGDYPQASAFDYNTSTGARNRIPMPGGPVIQDHPVTISEPGTHVFELRMGESGSSSLMASSGPFEVSSAILAAPFGLGATWFDQEARTYGVRWAHSEPGSVDWYELEERYPDAEQTEILSVSPGSVMNLLRDKESGPYGGYRYRVRACRTWHGSTQCSAWSEPGEWTVTDPSVAVADQVHPWASIADTMGSLHVGQSYSYAMGYHFRPESDGVITELGGLFNGTNPVRLYRRSDASLLAEVMVTSTNEWAFAPIPEVRVLTGEEYTVAVGLNGYGGAFRSPVTLPASSLDITILASTYVSTSSDPDAIPINSWTSHMYGQADIGFEPRESAQNRPPVIEPPPGDQEHRDGETVSLSIQAHDPDGDQVFCTLQGLPGGLAETSECHVGGTLTAAPGLYPVTVIASDGQDESQPMLFNWTVVSAGSPANPDIPPAPTAKPDFSVDAESARIGATPGNAMVDASGAANYSVPLMTAPGSGGFAPAVSLDYNSQIPNGAMGLGWSIGGTSSIVRCAQTREQDGKPSSAGISLSRDDRFCLDGQRLVLVAGQYGQDGSEYRTEIDTFARMVAYGSAGNGPRYFKVWSRDGSVSEYGNSSDSRIEARASGDDKTVMIWARNRLGNTAGNYFLYTYLENTSGPVDFSLSTVRYTGNDRAGTSPYAEIRLVYSNGRADTPLSFVRSAAFSTTRLLTRIDSMAKVNAGDVKMQSLRSYFLEYGQDGYGRKTLESLLECRDYTRKVCFPPTIFSWLKTEHVVGDSSVVNHSLFPDSFSGMGIADVNGDGRPDLLITSRTKTYSYFKVAFARGDGKFFLDSNSYTVPTYGNDSIPVRLTTIDLNADSFQDVIYPKIVLGQISWYARMSNGTGLGGEIRVAGGCCNLMNPSMVRVMDYDGDGLADLVTNRHTTGNDDNGDLVLLRNRFKPGGASGFEPYQKLQIALQSELFPVGPTSGGWLRDDDAPQFINTNPASAVGAQPFDFNGDGRVDLLARLSRRYEKCDSNCPLPVFGESFDNLSASFQFQGAEDETTQPEDSARRQQTAHATFYVVFESTEEGGFREHSIIATGADCDVQEVCDPFADRPKTTRLTPVDINADGLADIAYMDESFDWYYQLNTGEGFMAPQWIASPENEELSEKARFLDTNGDGYPELIYPSLLNQSSAVWTVHINDNGVEFASSVESTINYGNPLGGDASILLDFTGDGMLDNLFIQGGSSSGNPVLRLHAGENLVTGQSGQAGNVIQSIRNGFGAVSQFTYQPLTNDDVYRRMRNATAVSWGNQSPVYDLVAPIYVVSSLSQSAPVYGDPEAVSIINYRYVGGKIQAGGRGFLGFAEVIAYDAQNGIRTHKRYRQGFPYTGLIADVSTVLANPGHGLTPILDIKTPSSIHWPVVDEHLDVPATLNGKLLAYRANQWVARETVPGKGAYARQLLATLDESFSLAGQLKRKDVTANEFDEFDQVLTSITRTWGSDSGGVVSSKTTRNTYTGPDLGEWVLGQLSSNRVTHSRPGTPAITRQSAFEYDPVSRQMRRQVAEPGNPALELVHNYELDHFGNRTSVNTSASDLVSRIQKSRYDPLGRTVEREINGFGQVANQVISRDVFGRVLRSINMDGVLLEAGNDPMGRPLISYSETGNWKKSVFRNGSGSLCPLSTAYRVVTTAGGAPQQVICFDRVGRQLRVAKEGFSGLYVVSDQYFNSSGRLERESMPAHRGQSQYWTRHTYDPLGRLVFTRSAGDDDLHYAWDEEAGNQCVSGSVRMGLTRNALGQEQLEQRNALGETVALYDDQCSRLSYAYDAMGQIVAVTGADGHQVRTTYDAAGRKILLDDPDKGAWRYAYNALGELVRQLDAKGQAIDYEYDRLGRVTDRRELSGVLSLSSGSGSVVHHEETSWLNQTSSWIPGKGQVAKVVYRKGEDGEVVHQKNLIYDEFGRIEETLTVIGGQQFSESATYDEFGRTFQQFDASGDFRGLQFVYRTNGHLELLRESRDGSDGVVYQRIKATDALGNVTAIELGNGVEVFAAYSRKTGLLQKLEAFDAQGLELQETDYVFDVLGSLQRRHDRSNGRDLAEDFSYDSLNRLTKVELTAPADHIPSPIETMLLSYDASGNIRYKSDMGYYSYGQGGAGPHAVSSAGGSSYAYDDNGNQVSGAGRTITYSVFDKPVSFSKAGQRTQFTYGIGNQRITREDDNEIDGLRTTLYLGSVQRIESGGSTRFRRSLGGMASADYYPATGNQEVRYFVKDHLGSVHNITKENGRISDAIWMSFDAFGQRRDMGWQSTLTNASTRALTRLTARGFTGHEHVDSMGIIHMNGRIYDPKLGRFLQADPFVQDPRNSQSLNRYSYVLNNPLSYTDPSGYFSLKRFIKRWGRVIVAAVASYFTFGMASGWAFGLMPSVASGVATTAAFTVSAVIGGAVSGFVGGAIVGGNLKGAVKGAFIGATFAYIGSQIRTGIQNWKSGRGEVWHVNFNSLDETFVATRVEDASAFKIDRLFVNGQSNSLERAMELGSQQLGNPNEFYIFHNPTHGFIADTVESALGKITNSSSISRHLSEVLSRHGHPISNITAHSQGAIILSNAFRQMPVNSLTSSTTINFNGAGVGPKMFSRTVSRVGAMQGLYQANTFDAVPNILGMGTLNPFRIIGSILFSPLLMTPLSSHTVYTP